MKNEDLIKKVLEGVGDYIAVRDKEKSKLERLISAHDKYASDREQIGMKLGKLHGQATMLIAEGKNPDKIFKEEREAKADADQLDSLVQQLTEVAIPAQMKVLKESQDTLRVKLQEAVLKIKTNVAGAFEQRIQEASELQTSWGQFLGEIRTKIGVGVSDDPHQVRSFALLVNSQKSQFWALERLIRGE